MANNSIQLLEKFVDYCSLKNKTISRNIANIGTQNYKREDVKFDDLLKDSMKSELITDNPKHIKIDTTNIGLSDSSIVNDKITEGTGEVNNVNLEKEMAELAKNTLNYKFATKRLGEYFKEMQSAIKGG